MLNVQNNFDQILYSVMLTKMETFSIVNEMKIVFYRLCYFSIRK